MDWNWFFSSVAQSFAALVGIIAAFTITSIVSNQGEYVRRTARIRELLASSRELVDKLASRYFNWYNKHELESALDSAEAAAKGRNAVTDSRQLYVRFRFPPFVPRAEILKKIEDRVRRATRPPEPPRRAPYDFPMHDFSADDRIFRANLQPRLEAERERIDAILVEVRQHTRIVGLMLNDIEGDPEDSPLVRRSLAATLVLFVVGVLYPLSFLPMTVGAAPKLSALAFFPLLFSLRGAILAVATTIFSVICIALIRVSSSLKYPETMIAELRPFASLNSYSRYLEILVENEKEEASEARAAAEQSGGD